MKKNASIAIVVVFLGFIGLFAVLHLAMPDWEMSQQENRYLQQFPTLTAQSLFSGDFTSQTETYTTDQFPFRDTWITIKARCELLIGKKENNDVYYCGNSTLISRFNAPTDEVIAQNVSYLNTLVENVDIPVYFGLIPGAAEIQADKLPANAPSDSQEAVIEFAYAQSNAFNVNILSILAAHNEEYIYYRTDHHWTSLGAFYGYTALRRAWGLSNSKSVADYNREIVSDSFYGTLYSSSGFTWVEPDEIEIFVPEDDRIVITNYSSSVPANTPLYDESYLSVKDKYSMFLGGSTPRLSIDTGQDGKPRLVIIRDSYTDSLLPFLLDDFSQIDILDLRYYKNFVAQYIQEGEFDMVLILYSVDNFSTDTNLFLLAM